MTVSDATKNDFFCTTFQINILPRILVSAKRVLYIVKTFGNNGKNISENIVKLKLEQNIKSLLYNHLV